MLILAIDTALDACAAAVLDTKANRLLVNESQAMQRGHAEALVPLLGRVMDASGIGFLDIDRIAVTIGPGSFTGLRVGLSAARGIALAAAKPVVGLTTLSVFAAPLVNETDETPILSMIDARHNHIYYQLVTGNGTMIVHPRVAPIAEVLEAARYGPPRLVGNAAQLIAEHWPALTPPPLAVDQRPAPDISWLAWLGAAAIPEAASAKPFYLRSADAKPKIDPSA